jgi:LEA14-like dessication related protein
MRLAGWIAACLLVVSVASCKFQEVSISEVKSMKVKNVTKDGVTLDIAVAVKNPNTFKVKVTKADLDIWVSGKDLGTTKLQKTVVIPKESNTVHHIIVETKLKKLAGGALASLIPLFSSGSVNVKAKGFVKAKALGIGKKFDVDMEERVNPGRF